MTTQPHTESSVIRFFDNFLQEKNIKWVLATGMLILLGSSLMVVMPHWDVFKPMWRFLTIVTYTGSIFAAGFWSYHKLALRKTGTALFALAVLMVPVSFMAWHWLWASDASVIGHVTAIVLLGLNTVVATSTSRKTFRHFLRSSQPTFVASYLVLSMAGAIAPSIRDAGALGSWLASIVLWGVFSIGVVKVNRHIFWLTEEHRSPRILGFFPILLLGGQFLVIFATNFARNWSAEWIGFGCVLVAIPVLLTADAVAKVFQERTGNLVRPIPWPIMLPFTVGLILCITGVGVAGTAIFQRAPYALVPTAALAACLMAVTARRTNRTAFVWAMLVGVVLAYNFSPVFYQNVARAALAHGATAVKEARLPYAFYGLTYLPLILAATGAAAFAARRSNRLFARPLRQFCVGLSLMLLAASFGHVKALLPVAAVMTGVYIGLAKLFQDRRLAVAAVFAFLTATVGAVPFVETVLEVSLLPTLRYLVPLGGAVLLLVASPLLDRWIRRIPLPDSYLRNDADFLWTSLCRTASLVGTCGVAVAWLLGFGVPVAESVPISSFIIGGVLFAHSLVWLRSTVSWLSYAFVVAELVQFADDLATPFDGFATFVTFLLLGQWLLTYLFAYRPNHRVARAWADVNQRSAWIGLCLLMVFMALPGMFRQTVGDNTSLLILIRNILLTMWCFDATRYLHGTALAATDDASRPSSLIWRHCLQWAVTLVGCLGVYGVVSSVLVVGQGVDAFRWIPVAWTSAAIAVLPIVEAFRRRLARMNQEVVLAERYHSLRLTAMPIEATMYAILGSFAALHLFVFTAPLRVAGYIALGGLLTATVLRERPLERLATHALVNWTVLLACVQWFVPQATNLLDLFRLNLALAPWCVAAVASVSLLPWIRYIRRAPQTCDDFAAMQRLGLRIASFGALVMTLDLGTLQPFAAILAGCAFAALVGGELWIACRKCDETRVWIAEAIGALAVGYFLWFRVITLGRGISMFVTLGVGVLLYVAGVLASRRTTTTILARPLARTGLWMPLAAVGIGVFRHIARGDQVAWHGMNSLAILLAGGFYFWQAIEQRSKGFAVLSATILNIALALLWRELQLSDPQFYMVPIGISVLALVEILKREIPAAWHDPLRYAGGLTILVSPTFQIVTGSWLHLFTLMIASTVVLLVSIGLRVRAVMYTGAAFLIADLVGMVICGGIDHPNLLWIAGIGFGAAILTLGAVCEHNREKLLQRMRSVTAQLARWD